MPRKTTPTKRPAAPASRGRASGASSVAATPLPTLFRVRKPSFPRRNISRTKLPDTNRPLGSNKQPVTSTNRRAKVPPQHVSPVPSPATSASALTTPPKSATVVQPPTPPAQRKAVLTRHPHTPVRSTPSKPRTPKAFRVSTAPKIQKKLQFERRKTPARISDPPPDLPTTPVTGGSLRERPEAEGDCFATLAPCTESDEEYEDDVVDVRQDRLISPSSDPLISHVLQLFPPEENDG